MDKNVIAKELLLLAEEFSLLTDPEWQDREKRFRKLANGVLDSLTAILKKEYFGVRFSPAFVNPHSPWMAVTFREGQPGKAEAIAINLVGKELGDTSIEVLVRGSRTMVVGQYEKMPTPRTILTDLEKLFKGRIGLMKEGFGITPPPEEVLYRITTNEVIDFVKSLRTWFTVDVKESDMVSFGTREHGDVGSEQAGREDVMEANRIARELRQKFDTDIRVSVEVVDEWVLIDVRLK